MTRTDAPVRRLIGADGPRGQRASALLHQIGFLHASYYGRATAAYTETAGNGVPNRRIIYTDQLVGSITHIVVWDENYVSGYAPPRRGGSIFGAKNLFVVSKNW